MPVKVFSCAVNGMECQLVEVEVDIAPQTMPAFHIVGLADAAIQESKHRLRSALKNSHAQYPRNRKTINLAPAHLHKSGPLYDLPIALGLLAASGQIPKDALSNALAVGELALDGSLRPVSGVLAITAFAKQQGLEAVIVPHSNGVEAAIVSGINIIGPHSLNELIAHQLGAQQLRPFPPTDLSKELAPYVALDMSDIQGHEQAKRALEIAAAGGHNILLSGPPGSGKTLLAKAFPSILPKMLLSEALEVTTVYSVAGKLRKENPLIAHRPFRSVHHTASGISIVGGGRLPRPGEISLAHRGVLFFDEVPEFPLNVLEVLRQPMEEGIVSVTRASGSAVFPARFIFIGAMNPCPCGYAGDREKHCTCTSPQIRKYQRKLSGPFLDRMDLTIEVPRISLKKLTAKEIQLSSASMRVAVERARMHQAERFCDANIITNSEMTPRDVKRFCDINSATANILERAAQTFHLSGRAVHRLLKVSRTVADLENCNSIQERHLAEALQFRSKIDQNA